MQPLACVARLSSAQQLRACVHNCCASRGFAGAQFCQLGSRTWLNYCQSSAGEQHKSHKNVRRFGWTKCALLCSRGTRLQPLRRQQKGARDYVTARDVGASYKQLQRLDGRTLPSIPVVVHLSTKSCALSER